MKTKGSHITHNIKIGAINNILNSQVAELVDAAVIILLEGESP